MSNARRVLCGNCGRQLDEDLEKVERQPCPICGSNTRQYSENVDIALVVHEGLKFKHKDPRGRLKAKGASRSKRAGASGRRARESYVADRERGKWEQTVHEQSPAGDWETVHSEDIPLERKGAASWLMAEVREAARNANANITRSYLKYDFDSDTFLLKIEESKSVHRIPSEWVEDARDGDDAVAESVRKLIREAVAKTASE